MMFQHLNQVAVSILSGLANHLWQSTVFAFVIWLLVLIMRNHSAKVKYRLWLAASLKFLVPFSVLVDLGNHLAFRQQAAATASSIPVAIEVVSRSLAQPMSLVSSHAHGPSAVSGLLHLWPAFLLVLWGAGLGAYIVASSLRWLRLKTTLLESLPVVEGRELNLLRRLERERRMKRPIVLKRSSSPIEPGVIGIFRTVLVWPDGISEQMDDGHIEAVLAHELSHVRRRDNLAAVAHMIVEAIFWFHPLVWWMGSRLVEEREHACDEEVLRFGNRPQVYAESILKTCEFCVSSPLVCMSGVTGASLKERIARIMNPCMQSKLSRTGKLLLTAATAGAIAVPVALGMTNAPHSPTISPNAGRNPLPSAEFVVAAIRPVKATATDSRRIMMRIINPPRDGHFFATNITLKLLIRLAYGVQFAQIQGGPKWLDSDRYDIQAEASSSVDAKLRELPPREGSLAKQYMLRNLLAKRFQLVVQQSTKDMPVYTLLVARHGPKMKLAKGGNLIAGPDRPRMRGALQGPNGPTPGAAVHGGGGGNGTLSPRSRSGIMMRANAGGGEMDVHMVSVSMHALAQFIADQLDRTVVNGTGLAGRYDCELKWTPSATEMSALGGMHGPGMEHGGAEAAPLPNASGPSIFTALKEQLGLRLKSEKGPVELLIIKQAKHPTAN